MDRAFDRLRSGYGWSLGLVLQHRVVMLVVFVGVLYATVEMFGIVPKGFIPDTDNDSLNVNIQAAQGTSYYEMVGYAQRIADMINKNPYVEAMMANTGGGGGSAALQHSVDAACQQAVDRPADRAAAEGTARALPGIPGVRQCAGGPPDRRLPRQQQLQPQRPEPQLRRVVQVGAAAGEGDRRAARGPGRLEQHGAEEPARQHDDRSGQGRGRRPERDADHADAVGRLRSAAGGNDLRRADPVPRRCWSSIRSIRSGRSR